MNFLNFYQHLPAYINPVAFRVGSFMVAWYSLMYLLAFATVYLLLSYRIKKKEGNFNQEQITDFLIYAILGLLVGARLGYVFFYNPLYFWHSPLAIISPFDSGGNYTGIYGMSYFGGVAGIILAALLFVKKYRVDFWQLADFVVPAIPAGYFFGRLGNFLNGELFGRVNDKPWGMYFSDGLLRHPSQLYEAFFEGLILFTILWVHRNNQKFFGQFLPIYLFGYGFFRFFIEFFREPDPQLGLFFGGLTLNQVFSLLVMLAAVVVLFSIRRKDAKITDR
jgi:phosphatidylglycerol:prolipoprotein diacylglycerol transferase